MTPWLTADEDFPRSLPAGLTPADLARIDAAVAAHHAPSTRTTYASAWRGFETWCDQRGFTALPAAPEIVCAYITTQAERGLTMGMVTCTLAAIAHRHRVAGLDDPTDSELVTRVRRGLRRILGVAPRRRARPLFVEDIREILAAIDRTTAIGKRDAAIILLGFASAMRRCELAALEVGDIAPAEGGLLITVRRSKGDPHGAGQAIAIARGRHAESDPVEALGTWLRVRPRSAGSVFTRVRANGTVTSEPINAASVVRIVKTRAHAVGFTGDRITAHSLRAGHATAAAMAGVPLDRIAAQTRHRDLAMLVNAYIRPIASMQTTSSRHLGL
ncbi:tyrosine-type recombinase/integrase [Demequina soli]|uniref:tyrosine-type recombinase/integrase n=1 Tax=Demequina soli TaxID=1638987 RepID=UPI00078525E7|nr:tyrosine-type recombinase/integrase [Demequina soli]